MSATAFVVDDTGTPAAAAHAIRTAGLAVKTYASVSAFLKAFRVARAGCVICNLRAPETTGLDLLQRLRATGSEIPVLLVTDNGDVRTAVDAIKAGAIDILERPVDDSVLLDHVRRAIEHDAATRPVAAERADVARRVHLLSDRERQILDLVVEGLSNREIGERLDAKPKTVEAQRANMMKKMEAENLAHLIRMTMHLVDTSLPPDAPPSASG